MDKLKKKKNNKPTNKPPQLS